jgi:Plant transposon protein
VSAVVDCFEAEYLQEPTEEDLITTEKKLREAGWPGCFGAVDCAGWFWKNAPTELAGVLTGKEGKPCLRMEVVCDLDLWIWHFQFGLPGAYNDLNILEVNSHFNRVLAGAFPPIAPSYYIAGEEFRLFYYQADGIYPRWRIFAQTLSDPQTPQEKTTLETRNVPESVLNVPLEFCFAVSWLCFCQVGAVERRKDALHCEMLCYIA